MSDIGWFCAIALMVTLAMLAVLSWVERREDARFAEQERIARIARAMRSREATRNMRVRQPIPVIRAVNGRWLTAMQEQAALKNANAREDR